MAQILSCTSLRDCCLIRRIRSIFPIGFKTETVELVKMSVPMFLSQMMLLLVNFVSTIFCGHLGRVELAAVSLAISVINVTGISIGIGLASACDTLISQTFGGGNHFRIGVILQQAILILLLACFPCWAILINTEPILLGVRQEPEIARLAQMYVKIFMPALPAAFMFALQIRYLQNQGIIWPQVITGLVANIFNALINYIVIFVLNLGLTGSAVAGCLSNFAMVGILWIYIICKGLHKATWGGWSRDCLKDWGPYLRLAIPSMVMLCVEWWTYEIGGFLAGLISEVELGAQSVVYQLSNIAYMFPMGFSLAGSIRVGNALGAGNTDQAKLCTKVTLFCAVSVSVCLAILVGCLKDHISFVFTYDEQIRKRVSDIISFYAPFILLDATSAACGGIIRGAGKQKIGAVCYMLGYYAIGFPIGVPLMFTAKLGIKGLWTGLFVCMFLQCSFLVIYMVRMNWDKVTAEAKIRAGVNETSEVMQCYDATVEESDSLELVHTGPSAAGSCGSEELSFTALILRRGLALAAMLFILAVGITINVLVQNLIK
ncbi:multidrug and toxin extrusion protein 1 isoform X2 [Periophthalmus magnuspinnatus]|uniref:multidrug and toxin extrusion protein 1 isoform X2 n=1 Tax=Periophthalmus magnuspinnatus TaxID=409849 RepID=UPI00145BBFEA|nr:multidrug and toxin extrusion protein 1 isoform X2 [Periophthalmus magnuspinnatus]